MIDLDHVAHIMRQLYPRFSFHASTQPPLSTFRILSPSDLALPRTYIARLKIARALGTGIRRSNPSQAMNIALRA